MNERKFLAPGGAYGALLTNLPLHSGHEPLREEEIQAYAGDASSEFRYMVGESISPETARVISCAIEPGGAQIMFGLTRGQREDAEVDAPRVTMTRFLAAVPWKAENPGQTVCGVTGYFEDTREDGSVRVREEAKYLDNLTAEQALAWKAGLALTPVLDRLFSRHPRQYVHLDPPPKEF